MICLKAGTPAVPRSFSSPSLPWPNWEREFFQLAGVYLACRLRMMGGDVEIGSGLVDKGPLAFSLLGMHDYEQEMRLLIAEVRGR